MMMDQTDPNKRNNDSEPDAKLQLTKSSKSSHAASEKDPSSKQSSVPESCTSCLQKETSSEELSPTQSLAMSSDKSSSPEAKIQETQEETLGRSIPQDENQTYLCTDTDFKVVSRPNRRESNGLASRPSSIDEAHKMDATSGSSNDNRKAQNAVDEHNEADRPSLPPNTAATCVSSINNNATIGPASSSSPSGFDSPLHSQVIDKGSNGSTSSITTTITSSTTGNQTPRTSRRRPRQRRGQSSSASSSLSSTSTTTSPRHNNSAEKLRAIQASQNGGTNTNIKSDIINSTIPERNDEEDSKNQDDFAAQVLSQQHEHSTTPGTKKCFQIELQRDCLNRDDHVKILIKSDNGEEEEEEETRSRGRTSESNMDGLIPVLLMALHTNHWNVISMSKRPRNSDAREEQCIVVEMPSPSVDQPSVDQQDVAYQSQRDMDQLCKELRLLIDSTCDNFASQRSLKPVMNAFERSVGFSPHSSESAPSPITVVYACRSSAPPAKAGVMMNAASGTSTLTPSTSTLSSKSRMVNGGSGSASTMTTTTTSPNFQSNDSSRIPRPGAIPTPGRAFGAPVRRSIQHHGSHQADGRARRDVSGGGRRPRRGSRAPLRNASNWLRRQLSSRPQSNGHDDSNHTARNEMPVAAEVVEDPEDVEENIRKRIILEAATASVVDMNGSRMSILQEERKIHRRFKTFMVLLGLVLIGAVVGMAVGFSRRSENTTAILSATEHPSVSPSMAPSSSPTETPLPTLTTIVDRGYVTCCAGTDSILGRFETELCRGLAAAVFGNARQLSLLDCTGRTQYQLLANHTLDVAIQSTRRNLALSIHDRHTRASFSFSTPYFFDGFMFAGQEAAYVDCADNLNTYFGDCRRLVVCVLDASHNDFFDGQLLPFQNVQIVSSFDNVLRDGICNAIGAHTSEIMASLGAATDGSNLEGNFSIGTNAFTKEPLAILTSSEDYEWTWFVETYLQGLLEAEARGITHANALEFPSIPYVRDGYERMVAHAIESIGNFGEIYNRTIGNAVPRMGLNKLHKDSDCGDGLGLIYGMPIGPFIEGPVDRGDENGKIANVARRQVLKCGIPESLVLSLFHREICKAISIALFNDDNRFEAVPISRNSTDGFESLRLGGIDVLLGAESTVLPRVGSSLSRYFVSAPYFYQEGLNGQPEGLSLVTSSDDHQWSMLMQFVVNWLIRADELFLSKRRGGLPQGVRLAGKNYDRLMSAVIETVGNYDEIFANTGTPRTGCNLPNLAPHGPQHAPYLFQGLQ